MTTADADSVYGRVVDADSGAAVRGARVFAFWSANGRRRSLRSYATDADGGFAASLPREAGALEIVVTAPGHAAATVRLDQMDRFAAKTIRLGRGPGAGVAVRVVDAATGRGVDGIALLLRHRTYEAEAVSGPDGRVDVCGVPAGAATLSVAPDQRWVADGVWVCPCHHPLDPVELRVARPASLAVRVTGPEGPVAVVLQRRVRGEPCHQRLRVGPDGWVRFPDLLPGPYAVGVVLGDAAESAECEESWTDHEVAVTLGPGEDRTLALPVDPSPTGAMVCRVHTAEDQPVADVSVWLVRADAARWSPRLEEVTDPAGIARFDALPPGEYAGRAAPSPRDEPQAIAAVLGGAVHVDLTVPEPVPAGRLVLVRGSGPPPAAPGPAPRRIHVFGRVTGDVPGRPFVLVTGDARGSSDLVDGLVDIQCRTEVDEGRLFLRIGVMLPVALPFGSDGTVDLGDLVLEQGCTLRGRLAGVVWLLDRTYADVRVLTASCGDIQGWVATDGSFTVRGLPAEPARLEIVCRYPSVVARWARATVPVTAEEVARGVLDAEVVLVEAG